MVLRVEPLDLMPPESSRRAQATDSGSSLRGLRRSDLHLGGEHLVVLSYLSGGESVLAKLSSAEAAVARAAAAGFGNAEIAAQRGCSRFTVQNQLASAYRKLGVYSRAELTALLARQGADGKAYLIARVDLPEVRLLTPRERAVVELAALGRSNKAIAYELGLSAGTVGNYLMRAQRKLGARSRVALIRMFNVPAAPQ